MKTKKRSKILSLLLALSMLVGMVPFSVIPAMAAGFGDVQVTSSYPYDPNPRWVEINNSSGNKRGISYLKSLMDTTGPGYKVKYIKLTSDLKYLGDDNFNLTMSVNECVHLDLNGHKLIYGVDEKVGGKPFITVNGGSELHIYDSQNGGGYIHYLTCSTDENPLHALVQGLMLYIGAVPRKNIRSVCAAITEDKLIPATLSMNIYVFEGLLRNGGHKRYVLGRIEQLWGAMLNRGADTFWETSDGANIKGGKTLEFNKEYDID